MIIRRILVVTEALLSSHFDCSVRPMYIICFVCLDPGLSPIIFLKSSSPEGWSSMIINAQSLLPAWAHAQCQVHRWSIPLFVLRILFKGCHFLILFVCRPSFHSTHSYIYSEWASPTSGVALRLSCIPHDSLSGPDSVLVPSTKSSLCSLGICLQRSMIKLWSLERRKSPP